MLSRINEIWKKTDFRLVIDQAKDTFIMTGTEEIQILLEESQVSGITGLLQLVIAKAWSLDPFFNCRPDHHGNHQVLTLCDTDQEPSGGHGQTIGPLLQDSGRMDQLSKEVALFEANLLHARHPAPTVPRDQDFQPDREILERSHATDGGQTERFASCHRARSFRILAILRRANGKDTAIVGGEWNFVSGQF